MVKLHVRELLCNLIDHFIPHNHSISLGIGLGDIGELLARSRLSELESKSCDSLDPDTSEDGDFCSDQIVRLKLCDLRKVHTGSNFMVVAIVGSPTMTGVLAL